MRFVTGASFYLHSMVRCSAVEVIGMIRAKQPPLVFFLLLPPPGISFRLSEKVIKNWNFEIDFNNVRNKTISEICKSSILYEYGFAPYHVRKCEYVACLDRSSYKIGLSYGETACSGLLDLSEATLSVPLYWVIDSLATYRTTDEQAGSFK